VRGTTFSTITIGLLRINKLFFQITYKKSEFTAIRYLLWRLCYRRVAWPSNDLHQTLKVGWTRTSTVSLPRKPGQVRSLIRESYASVSKSPRSRREVVAASWIVVVVDHSSAVDVLVDVHSVVHRTTNNWAQNRRKVNSARVCVCDGVASTNEEHHRSWTTPRRKQSLPYTQPPPISCNRWSFDAAGISISLPRWLRGEGLSAAKPRN